MAEAAKNIIEDKDSLVMYIVVRSSLNMSPGKACAMCGHAVGMTYSVMEWLQEHMSGSPHLFLFEEWKEDNYGKIVLKATEKEWEQILKEVPSNQLVVVRDLGLTQLKPNTDTVIGLFPILKSSAPACIKSLPLY